MTTPTRDPWATLPTDWRTRPLHPTPQTPPPDPPPPPTRYYRPLPNLDGLPEPHCRPHCRRCHHPETRGSCRTCVIVCDHTKNPKPVDICITRTHATAIERRGPGTGRTLLLVADCPHCHRPHTHSTEPTSPYRKGACGQPYLLERTPA